MDYNQFFDKYDINISVKVTLKSCNKFSVTEMDFKEAIILGNQCGLDPLSILISKNIEILKKSDESFSVISTDINLNIDNMFQSALESVILMNIMDIENLPKNRFVPYLHKLTGIQIFHALLLAENYLDKPDAAKNIFQALKENKRDFVSTNLTHEYDLCADWSEILKHAKNVLNFTKKKYYQTIKF